MLSDLRYAFRQLAKAAPLVQLLHANSRQAMRRLLHEKGFTAAVVLTLAVCLGANLAIFAVVDAILLRPLPFADPDRLAIVTKDYPGSGIEHLGCSLPNYYDWRRSITAFSSVSALRDGSVVIGDPGSTQRVVCEQVTAEFFHTLGIKPAFGRVFTAEEMAAARRNVVVLTDACWRNRFESDPAILGRVVRLDGQACTVIGVLPRAFRFLSSRAQLYVPLPSTERDRAIDQRHSDNVQVIARLSDDATVSSARAEIDALDAHQLEDDPYAAQLKAARFHTEVSALRADHVRAVRPILLLLQGGSLCLLLIGGVNVTNLLLIRASNRTNEFAVRRAVGARSHHLVGEILLETVLLAGIGGALGVVAGAFGVDFLSLLGTEELPLGADVTLDARVVMVTIGGSLLGGAALAVPTSWFALRHRIASTLQSDSRSGTPSRAAQHLRHGFIVAQIALAFALLAAAGLFGVSLRRVLSVSPGFEPARVLTGHIELPGAGYRDGGDRLGFARRLLEELRGQPGVTAAAVATSAPFVAVGNGNGNKSVITVEGGAPQPAGAVRGHTCIWVDGDFSAVLQLPLRAGRWFTAADQLGGPRVCVIDESFARRYWPKGDAIGHRLARNAQFNEDEASTIVGVVGRIKQSDLAETDQGTVYFPYRANPANAIDLVVRTSLTPAAVASAVQAAVRRIDPQLPADDLRPMQGLIENSLIQRRSPALLAACFALVALALAALGTYGVLAYAVAQRQREIGIRIALGAQPAHLWCQFSAMGTRLLLGGVALGLLAASVVGRTMQGVLFGVTGFDAGVLGVSAGVLTLVVLAAVAVPARRAACMDPADALRGG